MISSGTAAGRVLANIGLGVLAVAAAGGVALALRAPTPPSSSSLLVAAPSATPTVSATGTATAAPTPAADSTAPASPSPTVSASGSAAALPFRLTRTGSAKTTGRTYEPDSAVFSYTGPKVGLVDHATNSWGPVEAADKNTAYVVHFSFTGDHADVVLHRGGTLGATVDGTPTTPSGMYLANGTATTVLRLTAPATHGSQPATVELTITGCLFGGVNLPIGATVQPIR